MNTLTVPVRERLASAGNLLCKQKFTVNLTQINDEELLAVYIRMQQQKSLVVQMRQQEEFCAEGGLEQDVHIRLQRPLNFQVH